MSLIHQHPPRRQFLKKSFFFFGALASTAPATGKVTVKEPGRARVEKQFLSSVAQVTTATIVGTVTDSGGAVVAGAQVTARNVDTGLTRTAVSSADGSYRAEFLPVGKYVVEVTYTGFKTAQLNDIVLQVNDTTRVDVSLTVGQVSETVTIADTSTPAVTPAPLRSGAPSRPLRLRIFRWLSATSTRCST